MSISARFTKLLSDHKVLIFSRTVCTYCTAAKSLLKSLGAAYTEINLETVEDGFALEEHLNDATNQFTVPNIFIHGKHIGGCDDMKALHQKGKLVPLLKEAGVIPA